MAKYLPPGYIDCALGIDRGTDPDPYSITFGCEIDTPPWSQDDNDDLFDRITIVLDGALWDGSDLVSLRTKVGSDGEGPLFESTGTVPGVRADDPPAPNTALLVRKVTGLGGRYNRGRMFWPSLNADSIDTSGGVSAGEVSFHQALFDDFLEVCQGVTGTPPVNVSDMVLIHSPRSGEATPTPSAVTALIVEDMVATQRRRLRS